MEYYDYVEFYNSPQAILTPDEEYLEWASENCPLPTEEDLQRLFEEMEV